MKQLAQYQDGRLELQDVPPPIPPPGGILVRLTHSVISPGTEKMKVEQARMSLLQKAKARPDQVRKVLDTAKTLGWKAAIEKVRNRLESPTPLGYSASGIVEGVDPANTRFRVGDVVACAGAECAHHAELIAVPDMLATPVPPGVEPWQAAYTTLLAISMHAVRQADIRLGERVLVVGQGLVGQLCTALVNASGARALAIDVASSRLDVSQQMGAERVANPNEASIAGLVHDWTDGYGVDAVLLCVGGKATGPVDQAVDCLRDRGSLVIVGMQDAVLDWKTCYAKEIQVRYSRSYGPGRYDQQYEWAGKDYPIGHVRWTENRNFEASLQLIASGKIDLTPVTTRRASFADAVSVYDALMASDNADIGVVLEYADRLAESIKAADVQPAATATPPSGTLSLDVIGAGNFARTMLLPHLKGEISLGTVTNHTGLSARHVKEKFGFANASAVQNNETGGPPAPALLISTRHHLHAPLVLQGLASNRHLFVEKPLCLTAEELASIDQAQSASLGSVMVGFNRRFAPATADLKLALAGITGPKTLACHVFAGPLSPDHWYANLEESGGRVIGEACHFFDFACHVLEARPVRVTAQTLGPLRGERAWPDGITAQVEFDDGSSFQLIYSAEGDFAFPKENLRLFASGLVAECENFQKLSLYQNRKHTVKKHSSKGHKEEMAAWLAFLKEGKPHPLPYAQAHQSMALTFAALESIRESRTVTLS